MVLRETPFRIESEFEPSGDQPHAIDTLYQGVVQGKRFQTLLGVTGSGKTFTMAHLIERTQKPTLVLAHNKTLAAQLYAEFKGFFPDNAVEYFVSYYDYYQPEAYIPRTDTYIEKGLAINDHIHRLRLRATRALIERRDVVIVSSVSCIYGLGLPDAYRNMNIQLCVGMALDRDDFLDRLTAMLYQHSEEERTSGTFRIRGEMVEVTLAEWEDRSLRIRFYDDTVESIIEIDSLTGKKEKELEEAVLYPASHHIIPPEAREAAYASIRKELEERSQHFTRLGAHMQRERLTQRTLMDLELMRETGSCKGIENYSRHFSQRNEGDPPSCLFHYFPNDFLILVDESHQTIPQMNAMYSSDRARKRALVEWGFRLPSAFDNRPLKFDEIYETMKRSCVVCISATPASWEMNESNGEVTEQIIRPTGLLDPLIEVRPARHQVDDALSEIRKELDKGTRVLMTTLTKRTAEDMTRFLRELSIRVEYIHSDVDTVERTKTLTRLRRGIVDVLVGINLLREGLDLPEVSLVLILDADKEGFLRSETSLVQTCGRAARHQEGRVILYADRVTSSIERTLKVTQDRRGRQIKYNKEHGITPKTVKRPIRDLDPATGSHYLDDDLNLEELGSIIQELRQRMYIAANQQHFAEAARLRDELHALEQKLV